MEAEPQPTLRPIEEQLVLDGMHHFLFPNVVEIKPVHEISTGHDDTFDHWKNNVLPFPSREAPPDIAA
jgi:hypothetical protein